MIRFLDREVIGRGVHRSGWPWCIDALSGLATGGILFDDFVERSFIYEPRKEPYREPWIGVFHHPPFIPNNIQQIHKHTLSNLTAMGYCKAWAKSKKYLTKAITFTSEAAIFIERWLGVQSFCVPHPTEIPEIPWTKFRYESNESKGAIQIGMQLRNLRAIYQLPPVIGIGKFRFKPYGHHIKRDIALKEFWCGKRIDFGGVDEMDRVSDEEYDRLLSANIAFLELFGAVANNVVVECIARSTPLLVNRLRATVEYLGPGYPLYYSNLHRAADLLGSDAVEEAHCYMDEMDKSLLSIEHFVRCVREVIEL